MRRIEPPRRPRPRRWKAYVGTAGGLLFISGFLEAVFAQSIVLLSVFLVYLLVVSFLGYMLGLWN